MGWGGGEQDTCFDRKRWGNNQDKICTQNKCWNVVMSTKMAETSQFNLPFTDPKYNTCTHIYNRYRVVQLTGTAPVPSSTTTSTTGTKWYKQYNRY